MSNPDPSVVRKAAAEFQVERPARFEILQPWKDVIEELRSKRASCHTIADFLNGYGIQASKSTIANFCNEVLNEKGKRSQRARRQKPGPSRSTQPAAPRTTSSSEMSGPDPNGKHLSLPNAADTLAGNQRKRGPRIASIELIDE